MKKTNSPSFSSFYTSWSNRANLAALTAAMALSYQALSVNAATPVMNVAMVTNLYSFDGTHGSVPMGKLAQTADGTFYGTTVFGGTNGGYGTLFKMSGGQVSSLFSFNNNNGSEPESGMIVGNDGNLYGTTHLGGIYAEESQYDLGYGTLFRLSTNGSFNSLASFNGTSGSLPNNLVQGGDGFFYGLAQQGGTNTSVNGLTAGTIFKADVNGNLSSLFNFNGTNGANPITGLTLYTNGTLYGLTIMANSNSTIQTGTAFQFNTNGNLSVLDYLNQTNGNQPGCLMLANDGNFYGTCAYGGDSGFGTIFQLTPNGAFKTIVSFSGTNGAQPQQLIQANDGYLYGVAAGGGDFQSGTIFQCTMGGALTNLYSFTGNADGANPSSIMQAKDGNFYGVTSYGGASDEGGIFKLTVAQRPEFTSYTINNRVMTLNFTTTTGLVYVVQHKATLNLDVWTNLSTITATGSIGVVTDNIGTNNLGFYRVGLVK